MKVQSTSNGGNCISEQHELMFSFIDFSSAEYIRWSKSQNYSCADINSCLHKLTDVFELYFGSARENIEELLWFVMKMHIIFGVRRHLFCNDTKLVSFDKMPPITNFFSVGAKLRRSVLCRNTIINAIAGLPLNSFVAWRCRERLVQYYQFETKEDACPYGYRRQWLSQ